jgi:hypothetical protein
MFSVNAQNAAQHGSALRNIFALSVLKKRRRKMLPTGPFMRLRDRGEPDPRYLEEDKDFVPLSQLDKMAKVTHEIIRARQELELLNNKPMAIDEGNVK